jgi:anaerobic ribonucleoside-triphosphate reductase activating protein
MIFRCAGISDSTIDGIGISLEVFFQGCHKQCFGCHNTELQDFTKGCNYDTNNIINIVKSSNFYDSIVFAGGEPLEQPEPLYDILFRSRIPTILYTGWLYKDIPEHIRKAIRVIIDGPYIHELRTDKFPASSNQKIYINGDLIENTSDVWRRI